MSAKNLETAIANWETDVRNFQDATGDKFPEANRKMGLINMCPDKLREYLRAYGKDRFGSYELIKREIVDWLVDEARRGKTTGGRAAALGEKDSGGAAEEEAVDVDWNTIDEDSMSHGQLLALVKNTKAKVQKGKGKGKAKGAPKVCYECGAEGHIAADCSVRKERVAAGGPERLPAEDVQMGNGKGGKAGGKGGKGGLKGGDGKGSFGKLRK